MNFRFYAWRFEFEAIDPIRFPALCPENAFRGALGEIFRRMECDPQCVSVERCERDCAYRRMFRPRAIEGPSGLADFPRPFVLRAAHLAGAALSPGERFFIDLHSFDVRRPAFSTFTAALRQLEREGVGVRRSRIRMNGADAGGEPRPSELFLNELGPEEHVGAIEIRFVTPTEIKGAGPGAPPFATLLGRVRERIGNLRSRYGDGPFEMDCRGFEERARKVRITGECLTNVAAYRRSSRTGERHPLGGFTGWARYEGETAEFMPWLRAAYWTGVGRQTVWGKGVLETAPIDHSAPLRK